MLPTDMPNLLLPQLLHTVTGIMSSIFHLTLGIYWADYSQSQTYLYFLHITCSHPHNIKTIVTRAQNQWSLSLNQYLSEARPSLLQVCYIDLHSKLHCLRCFFHVLLYFTLLEKILIKFMHRAPRLVGICSVNLGLDMK